MNYKSLAHFNFPQIKEGIVNLHSVKGKEKSEKMSSFEEENLYQMIDDFFDSESAPKPLSPVSSESPFLNGDHTKYYILQVLKNQPPKFCVCVCVFELVMLMDETF